MDVSSSDHRFEVDYISKGREASISKGISYAILSQPRTGSTLLRELLRVRGMGDPDEYLHTSRIDRFWPNLIGSDKPFDCHQYVRLLRQCQTQSSEHFGIKVHYSHLQAHLRDPIAIKNFFVGFDKVIVLNRANKLAQAVSALKADQTGQWRDSAPESKMEPTFDPIFIAEGIRRFLFQDRQISRLNLGTSPPALFISYEDLRDSLSVTWQKVQSFLGVTPDPLPTTIRVRPQRDALSLEFEERFLKLIRGEPVAD